MTGVDIHTSDTGLGCGALRQIPIYSAELTFGVMSLVRWEWQPCMAQDARAALGPEGGIRLGIGFARGS